MVSGIWRCVLHSFRDMAVSVVRGFRDMAVSVMRGFRDMAVCVGFRDMTVCVAWFQGYLISEKWWFVLHGFWEMVVCVAWFHGCDGLFQVYGRLCCLISGIWRSVLHGFQGCNGLCQEYGGPFCIISWIRRSVLVAGTLNSPTYVRKITRKCMAVYFGFRGSVYITFIAL